MTPASPATASSSPATPPRALDEYDARLIATVQSAAACQSTDDMRAWLRTAESPYASDSSPDTVRAAFTGHLQAASAELARMALRIAEETAQLPPLAREAITDAITYRTTYQDFGPGDCGDCVFDDNDELEQPCADHRADADRAASYQQLLRQDGAS